MRDSSRVVNLAKTVYDVDKDSPHYANHGDYMDPQQAVIQKQVFNGKIIESNGKKATKNRYYKTLKPWYVPYTYNSKANYNKAKYMN